MSAVTALEVVRAASNGFDLGWLFAQAATLLDHRNVVVVSGTSKVADGVRSV